MDEYLPYLRERTVWDVYLCSTGRGPYLREKLVAYGIEDMGEAARVGDVAARLAGVEQGYYILPRFLQL